MRWRSTTTFALVASLVAGACGIGSDAEQDPSQQPEVTVLGTSVGDGDQPAPTIGSAVSTER